MRVYKRGKHYWASWTENGRTVRRSTRKHDRKAAELVAARWEREHADPDHAAASTAKLGEAMIRFLAECEQQDKAAATVKMYRQKCGTLQRILGEDLLLANINARKVDAFIAARRKEPVAFDADGQPTRYVTPNTIHKELVALRGVLKLARRRGEFKKDPKEILPIGFATKYEPRNRKLTLDQAAKVMQELPAHRAAVVAFILATSSRKSEALNQHRADARLADGLVHVTGTKTAGSDRYVPVMPFVRGLLEFAVANGGGKDPKLFKPWPSMRRDILAACKRAGAPPATPNDLRRTLATWLIERAVPNHLVARVLGHVDTTMVDRVYGKASDAAIAQLIVDYPGVAQGALAAVPPVYQAAAQSSVTSGNSGSENAENPAEPALLPGHESVDVTIKSPQLYRLSYQPESESKRGVSGAPVGSGEGVSEGYVPPVYQDSAPDDGDTGSTTLSEPPGPRIRKAFHAAKDRALAGDEAGCVGELQRAARLLGVGRRAR